MNKFKQWIRSERIKVELALGVSILVLAYFSSRVLDQPLSYLELSITSFITIGYEAIAKSKYPSAVRFTKSIYWVIAILIATAAIIVLNIV